MLVSRGAHWAVTALATGRGGGEGGGEGGGRAMNVSSLARTTHTGAPGSAKHEPASTQELSNVGQVSQIPI